MSNSGALPPHPEKKHGHRFAHPGFFCKGGAAEREAPSTAWAPYKHWMPCRCWAPYQHTAPNTSHHHWGTPLPLRCCTTIGALYYRWAPNEHWASCFRLLTTFGSYFQQPAQDEHFCNAGPDDSAAALVQRCRGVCIGGEGLLAGSMTHRAEGRQRASS